MITQELVTYITQQRTAGKTKIDITQTLLGQGWSAADIEEVFLYHSKTPGSVPVPPQQSNPTVVSFQSGFPWGRLFTGFSIAVSAFLLAPLVMVGYIFVAHHFSRAPFTGIFLMIPSFFYGISTYGYISLEILLFVILAFVYIKKVTFVPGCIAIIIFLITFLWCLVLLDIPIGSDMLPPIPVTQNTNMSVSQIQDSNVSQATPPTPPVWDFVSIDGAAIPYPASWSIAKPKDGSSCQTANCLIAMQQLGSFAFKIVPPGQTVGASYAPNIIYIDTPGEGGVPDSGMPLDCTNNNTALFMFCAQVSDGVLRVPMGSQSNIVAEAQKIVTQWQSQKK